MFSAQAADSEEKCQELQRAVEKLQSLLHEASARFLFCLLLLLLLVLLLFPHLSFYSGKMAVFSRFFYFCVITFEIFLIAQSLILFSQT
jgi:hypothetical protein